MLLTSLTFIFRFKNKVCYLIIQGKPLEWVQLLAFVSGNDSPGKWGRIPIFGDELGKECQPIVAKKSYGFVMAA